MDTARSGLWKWRMDSGWKASLPSSIPDGSPCPPSPPSFLPSFFTYSLPSSSSSSNGAVSLQPPSLLSIPLPHSRTGRRFMSLELPWDMSARCLLSSNVALICGLQIPDSKEFATSECKKPDPCKMWDSWPVDWCLFLKKYCYQRDTPMKALGLKGSIAFRMTTAHLENPHGFL